MKTIEKMVICILLVTIFVAKSFSQTWTNYTTESTLNQLCSNQINCIIVDNKNNKWFGTDNGISVFDGKNWTSFDTSNILPDMYITCGAIDKDGALWFGTVSGSAVKYDGNEWTTYKAKDQLPGDAILNIAVDKQNNKWFGTYNSHLVIYDNMQWKQKDLSDLFGYSPDAFGIQAIEFDSLGYMFLGFTSEDHGFIIKYDSIYQYFASPNDNISCIKIDKKNGLWVGSVSGVTHYSISGSVKYNEINGTSWSHVSTIFIDEFKNKWIGTSVGLARFDDQNWISYTVNDGLVGDFVNAITMDHEGNIWVGTKSGISVSKFFITNVSNVCLNSEQLNVFPDPAKTILTISAPDILREVNIYDFLGKLKETIYTQNNSITINITRYKSGLYIIKVGDKFKKIVIE